ncbi:glutathione S-transferase kappa 1-like [Saccoglossus kowalevskii]|uniref:Glutathione S-transferase kappa n=1 Tax=Saccoglossus kowalevskii TaxID=10224 RepID=A0ABM0GTL5_SACKO|nr:PREDICTED: glutathione S-transferase kappa 1-like [Saccoglossus kowalevskii]
MTSSGFSQVGRKTVELFYDVVSPYSWIGFELLCRYRHKWNIDLKFKPFFLGAIMHYSKNSPPGSNLHKGNYAGKDLHRLRSYCNIPLNAPSDVAEVMFVKGTLSAQRLLTAISMDLDDKAVEDVSRELWLRIWSKDKDITEADSLLAAATNAGIPMEKAKILLTRIKDQDVKDKLKERTETALSHGAFGAPTILVHVDGKAHMYFGSDRMPLIAHLLGEKYEGPLPELSKL